jgi:quinoprotein relay system zinc metallohydrolase 2
LTTRAIVALPVALLALAAALTAARDGVSLPVTQLAEGVYVHQGFQQDAGPANLGDIANIGFIVGEKCVAVIDTGGTAEVGRRLRNTIRESTPLPVCYVINTHVHPDHIFGNAAFKDDKPQFVGHAKLPAAMAARGRNYLNALSRDYAALAQGSEMIPPALVVSDTLELDLGGRVLRLKAWPTAHTDNDLTVYDEKTGTLWLSDLLFVERIPVVDGSLKGWVALHPVLAAMTPKHVVAGHGEVKGSLKEALSAQERYLNTLLEETRAAIKARRSISQAIAEVGTGERGRWLLFESFHPRNVTAAYAELEWED